MKVISFQIDAAEKSNLPKRIRYIVIETEQVGLGEKYFDSSSLK